jgi:hypothetical protein
MGRPGAKAAYFGPCVAQSPAAAEDLLCWFLACHHKEPVYWDILPENREAVALAGRYGFRPVRKLTRMLKVLKKGVPLRTDIATVFAIAGFEFG